MTYLVYNPHIPKGIEFAEGEMLYVVVKNDVAILAVPEKYNSHVPRLLGMRGCTSCNSGAYFRMATAEEVVKWLL
jgi:hypothetical protein